MRFYDLNENLINKNSSDDVDELGFAEGEKVTNINFIDEGWWTGKAGGTEGMFPASYIKLD